VDVSCLQSERQRFVGRGPLQAHSNATVDASTFEEVLGSRIWRMALCHCSNRGGRVRSVTSLQERGLKRQSVSARCAEVLPGEVDFLRRFYRDVRGFYSITGECSRRNLPTVPREVDFLRRFYRDVRGFYNITGECSRGNLPTGLRPAVVTGSQRSQCQLLRSSCSSTSSSLAFSLILALSLRHLVPLYPPESTPPSLANCRLLPLLELRFGCALSSSLADQMFIY
jgi:hypothetical protein